MQIDSQDARMDLKTTARSCVTCSKAKAKCLFTSKQRVSLQGANKTETKGPQIEVRLIHKIRTFYVLTRCRSRAAQLEKLESKIEHLVYTLSHQQGLPHGLHSSNALSPSRGQPNDGDGKDSRINQTSDMIDAVCCNIPSDGIATPSTHTLTGTSPSYTAMSASLQHSQPIDNKHAPLLDCTAQQYQSIGTSLMQAEILLDRYRRLMAPELPFVAIPSHMTAQHLYTEKPLLLRAIVTVAYFHNLPEQRRMVKMMMRDVSERVLLNNEKNVGIIQAILVFVAWYHPHVFWGQQATNLLHLAMAAVVDLAIDRPPGMNGDGSFKAAAMKQGATHFVQRTPTLEEYRALAGVFYLSSTVATSFKKLDPFQPTKYLDECIMHLAEAKEYQSDALLVQMVRLQKIAHEVIATEASTAPMQMYVKVFEAEVEKLQSQMPCHERESDKYNMLLQMQYLSVKILVYELPLSELLQQEPPKTSASSALRSHMDSLHNLTEAIRSFVNVYFTIPLDQYLTTSFAIWGQFAHCFITLSKLATLDIDGWDWKASHFDFVKIVDEAALYYDRAGQSSPDGLTVVNDSFVKWASRLRWLKQLYESRSTDSRPEESEREAAASLQSTKAAGYEQNSLEGAQQPTPPDDWLPNGDFFSGLDDNFWSTLIGEADFGLSDPMI
ncbi:hypothetical protein D0865_11094 [Hortaea werneckii]|uniref:Transcription factor domain-containing protein n=1 Tax=Hortaea werneckii TaxID=91943 RepID=A0A3M7BV35_HORWE|nr:hypothetical protein D0865_11094 [Hortaea werneckii]